MGKQKKSKAPEKKKQSPVIWVIVGAIVVVAVLAVSGNLPFTGASKDTGKSFNLTSKETRPLLNPAQFTGQVRMAYAAAEKYPELMNEVFCYCYCDQPPFRHNTLLSCFTDKHAAG
jgi:flagellar basal body-associated protein FliL